MKVYIYTLKDPNTQEIRYIGQAVNIEERLKKHILNAKNSSFTRHIYNWMRTLSCDPIIECIEECDNSNCNERERYWIKYYKEIGVNLCNHSNGGEGAGIGNTNCVGRKLSQETKNKLSKAHKYKRETLHISSGTKYESLKEACRMLNLSYVNEFTKLKKGTSKTFLYTNP